MTDAARARLMVALATVPPLTCCDCGALVRLERAVSVKRGPVALDLCPACYALDLAGRCPVCGADDPGPGCSTCRASVVRR